VAGWQASVAADIKMDVNGNLTSTVDDFTTMGLNVGQMIKIGGSTAGTQFATAAYNGFAYVKAIAAHLLTLEDRSWTVGSADTAAGKTVQLLFTRFDRNVPINHADYLEPSLHGELEEIGPGHCRASTYTEAKGLGVKTFEINAPLENKIVATVSYVGTQVPNPVLAGSRITGPSTAYAPLKAALFDTASDLKSVRLFDATTGTSLIAEINNWKLTFENNITARKVQATLGTFDLVYGKFTPRLTMEVYYTDYNVQIALNDNRDLRWDARMSNGQGGYAFRMPLVGLRGGPRTYPGERHRDAQLRRPGLPRSEHERRVVDVDVRVPAVNERIPGTGSSALPALAGPRADRPRDWRSPAWRNRLARRCSQPRRSSSSHGSPAPPRPPEAAEDDPGHARRRPRPALEPQVGDAAHPLRRPRERRLLQRAGRDAGAQAERQRGHDATASDLRLAKIYADHVIATGTTSSTRRTTPIRVHARARPRAADVADRRGAAARQVQARRLRGHQPRQLRALRRGSGRRGGIVAAWQEWERHAAPTLRQMRIRGRWLVRWARQGAARRPAQRHGQGVRWAHRADEARGDMLERSTVRRSRWPQDLQTLEALHRRGAISAPSTRSSCRRRGRCTGRRRPMQARPAAGCPVRRSASGSAWPQAGLPGARRRHQGRHRPHGTSTGRRRSMRRTRCSSSTTVREQANHALEEQQALADRLHVKLEVATEAYGQFARRPKG
jgi:hypothetical protein